MSAGRRTDPALSRNSKPPPFRRWLIHVQDAAFDCFSMWRPQTFDVASVVNAFHERAESRLFLLQPELLYLVFDDAFDPRIK